MQRDRETGLDYFNARYYRNVLGRFTSVDPGPAVPGEPQSWNRYAYVQNNPLKYIDPTGRTLILTGPDAQNLLLELEFLTGLELEWDAKNPSKVVITKGSKRDTTKGSARLAQLVRELIGAHEEIKLDVGSDLEMVFVDAVVGKLDWADYKALKAAAPELATTLMGHVLKEQQHKARTPHDPLTGHDPGREFEVKVMEELTGIKEPRPRQDWNVSGAEIGLPSRNTNLLYKYAAAFYFITLHVGPNGSPTVTSVVKVPIPPKK
jgi:RHS repeat-associated protein